MEFTNVESTAEEEKATRTSGAILARRLWGAAKFLAGLGIVVAGVGLAASPLPINFLGVPLAAMGSIVLWNGFAEAGSGEKYSYLPQPKE